MIGGESWGSAVTPESDDDGGSAAVANRPYHTTHQTFSVDRAEANEQSTTRVAAHTSANDARYRGLTQKVGFDIREIVESTWDGEQPIHLIEGSYDIIMRTAYSVKKHLESENAGQTVQPFSIFCGTVMQIGNAKLIELCNRMAAGKAQQELFFSQLASQPSNFLYNCSSLTSVDLSRLRNLQSIGGHFLYNCWLIISVDLRNAAEPGKSVIRNALKDAIRGEWWQGTIVG